jgi:hypothetical protein
MRPFGPFVVKSCFYLLEAVIGPGIGLLLVFFGFNVWPSIDLFESVLLAILILYSSTILGICCIGMIYARFFLPQYNIASGIVSCILGSFVGVLFAFPVIEILNAYVLSKGFLVLSPLIFPIVSAIVGFNVGLREVNK